VSRAPAQAVVLVVLALGGCSSGHDHTSTNPTNGKEATSSFDSDDAPVRFFGHEASGRDRREIVGLMRRYYAAAARADGAKACRMIHTLTIESIREEYEERTGRSASCASIVADLFRRRRHQLALDSATLEIASIRVGEDSALVLVDFAKAPLPNHIAAHREAGAWKIWELFDGHMP
jgi:hypothetical protein